MEQKEQFSWGGIEPLCVVRRVLRQLPAIIAGGVIAVLCAWMAMTGLLYRQHHPGRVGQEQQLFLGAVQPEYVCRDCGDLHHPL